MVWHGWLRWYHARQFAIITKPIAFSTLTGLLSPRPRRADTELLGDTYSTDTPRRSSDRHYPKDWVVVRVWSWFTVNDFMSFCSKMQNHVFHLLRCGPHQFTIHWCPPIMIISLSYKKDKISGSGLQAWQVLRGRQQIREEKLAHFVNMSTQIWWRPVVFTLWAFDVFVIHHHRCAPMMIMRELLWPQSYGWTFVDIHSHSFDFLLRP